MLQTFACLILIADHISASYLCGILLTSPSYGRSQAHSSVTAMPSLTIGHSSKEETSVSALSRTWGGSNAGHQMTHTGLEKVDTYKGQAYRHLAFA
ncbi:hypothetical protein GOP47_0015451 [Adiantum capillus-veneris]|uniref:Secreted protein n=1 Tax=Adiantum capillus-veneris TaxID=13818 RepID=A0A9D4UJS7_ADICA|nr:hypothetical protein GOP47_0015451 [Adiantum capillus-veneris]